MGHAMISDDDWERQMAVIRRDFATNAPDALVRAGIIAGKYRAGRKEAVLQVIAECLPRWNPHRHEDTSPGPTSEAVLQPGRYDPIAHLHHKGVIDDAQKEAADCIVEIFQSVAASLMARVSQIKGAGGPPRHSGRAPVPLSDWVSDMHAHVYKPWAEGMGAERLPLIIAVVVDGHAIREARGQHHMGHARAIGTIRFGLADFARRWTASKIGRKRR